MLIPAYRPNSLAAIIDRTTRAQIFSQLRKYSTLRKSMDRLPQRDFEPALLFIDVMRIAVCRNWAQVNFSLVPGVDLARGRS